MTYRAKSLPAWVRFRPKPKPLPVYTVPTAWEHRMALMLNAAAQRLAAQLAQQNDWVKRSQEQTEPLRVRLTWDLGAAGRA